MKQIIEGIRYDTEKATLLTSDRFWDGSNQRAAWTEYLPLPLAERTILRPPYDDVAGRTG